MWPASYEDALSEWSALRTQTSDLELADALHTIQNWWQHAPLVEHYLHVADYEDWPLPWDLLADNTFCDLAISLGMCYTLLLIKHKDINSLCICQTANYSVVDINGGQYTLNDQPGSITSDIDESEYKYSIDCEYFRCKLN